MVVTTFPTEEQLSVSACGITRYEFQMDYRRLRFFWVQVFNVLILEARWLLVEFFV